MAVYGVFDGHGGKQAANFASRNLTDKLLAALEETTRFPEHEEPESTAREELQGCSRLGGEDWALWQGQDRVIDALPAALTSAFQRVQADFFENCKVSGLGSFLDRFVGYIEGKEFFVERIGERLDWRGV